MGATDMEELKERLSELRTRSSTPPLGGTSPNKLVKTSENFPTDGGSDSGYGSIAASPDSQKTEFLGSDLPGTKLKYFSDKHIPDRLKARFFDIKVLYTQPLIDALSKKSPNPGDISMKLKYLGSSSETAELYIVVQCHKRASKRIKKFFAQAHVQEELKPQFRVLVLNKELTRLSDGESPHDILANEDDKDGISVLSYSFPTNTFCGMQIEMTGFNSSVVATFGGLIMVELSEKRLYGVTAAHPLQALQGSQPPVDEESDWESDYSDSESDYESSDSLNISPYSSHSGNFGVKDEESIRRPRTIGKVIYNIFSAPVEANYDWALIDLNDQEVQPNSIMQETQFQPDDYSGEAPKPINLFSTNSHPEGSERVIVLSCRGPQPGVLAFNGSCLKLGRSSKFVTTHDLTMDIASGLIPGDSGSWVVNGRTGEVFGFVVSLDAFGEAQVMPIESALESIKTRLGASRVFLPTLEDIQAVERHRWSPPGTQQNRTSSASRDYYRPNIWRSSLNPAAEPWEPPVKPMEEGVTHPPFYSGPIPYNQRGDDDAGNSPMVIGNYPTISGSVFPVADSLNPTLSLPLLPIPPYQQPSKLDQIPYYVPEFPQSMGIMVSSKPRRSGTDSGYASQFTSPPESPPAPNMSGNN